MLKTFAIAFGVIMLLIGALGFVPQAVPDGRHLFGIFHINTIHNFIHLATGLAALLCGLASEYASRLFFQIFGILYAIVAGLGFYYMDEPILGLVANNMADNILHVAIAAASLFLGFIYEDPDTLRNRRF